MQNNGTLLPLPATWKECTNRGWTYLDILLVSGDAYIDHPSFGVTLIGRLLESKGYKVAILAQPHFDNPKDFSSFPSPRLFCGITAGNLDSIVANYSGNGKVRDSDAYSPDGNPWRGKEKSKNNRRRPDRASIIYANLARSAFPGTPIILGGVEASLRRFTHYDYKQRKLRASILTDAKADVLVFGMGEKAVVEIAEKLVKKEPLLGIKGTCSRITTQEFETNSSEFDDKSCVTLPSWDEINKKKELFLDAELEIDQHAKTSSQKVVIQKQQTHWVVQYPQHAPLSTQELDHIYSLPFTRQPHPLFQDVPAFRMIKDSITIVRGCSGNCSFCSITRHQGPITSSRSVESIVQEAKDISSNQEFTGTISDLGGPTANLFGTSCNVEKCNRHDCLFPKVCKNLIIDEKLFLRLLKEISNIPTVNHVFISSGLRMELLRKSPSLLREIIAKHTPGALKIAPEHTEKEVLRLMHKEPVSELEKTISLCNEIARSCGKKMEINPYIISAHPGCTEQHTREMVKKLKRLQLTIRGFQDFTPTPGSLSTAMYYSGLDKDTKKAIHIPDEISRKKQRAILEREFFKQNRAESTPKHPPKRRHAKKRRR